MIQYTMTPCKNSIHQMVENYSNLIGPTCPHKETHVSNDLKSWYKWPLLHTECRNNKQKIKISTIWKIIVSNLTLKRIIANEIKTNK